MRRVQRNRIITAAMALATIANSMAWAGENVALAPPRDRTLVAELADAIRNRDLQKVKQLVEEEGASPGTTREYRTSYTRASGENIIIHRRMNALELAISYFAGDRSPDIAKLRASPESLRPIIEYLATRMRTATHPLDSYLVHGAKSCDVLVLKDDVIRDSRNPSAALRVSETGIISALALARMKLEHEREKNPASNVIARCVEFISRLETYHASDLNRLIVRIGKVGPAIQETLDGLKEKSGATTLRRIKTITRSLSKTADQIRIQQTQDEETSASHAR